MNHILDLQGYPPTVITKKFREDYLDAMNQADRALDKSLVSINLEHYKELINFAVLEFS
mgnify:CR=1 FL=1